MRLMNVDVAVRFASWDGVAAQYGNQTLTFNCRRLDQNFFDSPIQERTLDLIIHELGHEYGNHTQETYHSALTSMGAQLTRLALNEPKFFDEKK